MSEPRAPQWVLTPVLRLAVLAMLLSTSALMTVGLLSLILWASAAVLVVIAAVKLVKSWGRQS
jgi:hypothetical protein